MNLKFWRTKTSDETEISVTESDMKHHKHFYVKAQTADKALELFNKLRDKEK